MMQLPPVNYDHSFDGQVVEHRLSNEAAAMACARIGVFWRIVHDQIRRYLRYLHSSRIRQGDDRLLQ